ncbi:MAG TPA: CoA transferase [Sneathiellales bacterium]|nr:CoA transferase [Sneathiellales bacterium]
MKLEGIKVIDMSCFLPGPQLTTFMSDHGADVIRIENVNGGEPNRIIGPKRDDTTVYFAATHRGKKSLALNLKDPDAVEAVMRLAEQSDVFVEAFRPGVVKRLGVSYEDIKKRAPHIVYVSISAFGQDGPYVQKPAHDMATEAYCGVLSLNLGQDGKPWNPAIPAADMLGSMIALSGVLMALYRRQTTGKGDYLDIAMMDSVFASIPNQLGTTFANKQPPDIRNERTGGGYAMYRPYETKEGAWIVLGAAEIHFAINLLNELGRPDLIDLCRLPPGTGQYPVQRYFEETFKTKTKAEWVTWFEGKDISFAPVNNLREGCDDPQVRHREMIVEDERGWEYLGIPIKFADEPGSIDFAVPGLGEHSEEILRSVGLSDDTLERMKQAGVY